MDPRTETVVFIIEDPAATAPFWEAFKAGTTIYGMRPIAVATGDQMTIPSQLADELCSMTPLDLDRAEMADLIRRAQRWDLECLGTMGLPKAGPPRRPVEFENAELGDEG